MSNQEDKHSPDTRNAVMERIRKEDRRVKSRGYFLMRTIVNVFGLVFLALTAIYILSLIVFITRGQGLGMFLDIGPRGAWLFLTQLPWLLILLALGVVLLVEIMVRRYGYGYRQPILITVGGVLLIVVMGSLSMLPLQLHERTLASGPGFLQAPLLGKMCQHFDSGSVVSGTIAAITSEYIEVEVATGQIVTIVVTPATRVPRGHVPSVGEAVIVLADKPPQQATSALGILPPTKTVLDIPKLCLTRGTSSRSGHGPWWQSDSSASDFEIKGDGMRINR